MSEVKGFLKADNDRLVNGDGQEVLLRGVGLGNWLLPEGYMWLFPEKGDRPRRIEKMIKELVGGEKADEFWNIYYDTFITEADITRIANEGFNSIRLPINSRFLLESAEEIKYNEEHMQLIDRVINWCRENKLYVILDLHGAPGGQTGTNIDDSANNKPELFIEDKYRKITINLWEKLADRYKDEWIVAGYDLLNEPLPDWFSQYNDRVIPLYKEKIEVIRKIDKHHLIILEGVHWSTDWSIFEEKIADNIMLQFHKYWNNPDTESINQYLDKREELQVPIFMGEGGENNKEWYTGAFRLFEDHQISWNFWTWKKMNTTNSPCSIKKPQGWDKLINYLGGGPKPGEKYSEEILWEYLDNILFNNCVYHRDVVRSLFRRPPVLIPSVFYGYRGKGKSYDINKWHPGEVEFRPGDGTNIKFIDGDGKKANFEHQKGELWKKEDWLYVQLDPGEWLSYEFNVNCLSENNLYTVDLCVSVVGNKKGVVEIFIDDKKIKDIIILSLKKWGEISLNRGVNLGSGEHRVVLKTKKGSIKFKWLKVKSVY